MRQIVMTGPGKSTVVDVPIYQGEQQKGTMHVFIATRIRCPGQ